ncbi:ATE1 [Bugula neritina]|uniref:ATE1 n=1 Tax=Bugula neritina TaxID=10212 RepID=A0A7J7JCT9_BUGNE|nr:ATE1 [Bugula neritina]
MGFYIHSCLKMKYKAKFSPSYLLCPETYLWVPIEQCLPKLDVSKYSRLCDDSAKVDAEAPSSNDHKLTYCLYSRQIVPYGILSARQGRRADQEEVKMYTDLIGCRLNQRLLMYREM